MVSENTNGNLELTFSSGRTIELKKPTLKQLGQALVEALKDPLAPADLVVKQLMVKPDKTILDSTGMCHQIVRHMDDIFGKINCVLEWKNDQAHVLFDDDVKIILRVPTRKEYSVARAASKTNPLRFVQDILKSCWIEGPESVVCQSSGHLLGFTEVADDFINYEGERLGN